MGSWWGQSWGDSGSRAWVTVESRTGVRVLRSILGTNSGLSQHLQTQDPVCLWPLLGAAVGLPVPPKVIAQTRAPWAVEGTPRCRLARSHCHPLWEPGAASPGEAHAPDLTTAQMIRMFWGGLSLAATPGSCSSSSGSIPSSPSGTFHNPDLQTPCLTGTAALFADGFFWRGKLPYNSAVSSLP